MLKLPVFRLEVFASKHEDLKLPKCSKMEEQCENQMCYIQSAKAGEWYKGRELYGVKLNNSMFSTVLAKSLGFIDMDWNRNLNFKGDLNDLTLLASL